MPPAPYACISTLWAWGHVFSLILGYHMAQFFLAALLQEWVSMLEKDSNIWDQNAFNDLFRRGSRPLPDRADRLFE